MDKSTRNVIGGIALLVGGIIVYNKFIKPPATPKADIDENGNIIGIYSGGTAGDPPKFHNAGGCGGGTDWCARLKMCTTARQCMGWDPVSKR